MRAFDSTLLHRFFSSGPFTDPRLSKVSMKTRDPSRNLSLYVTPGITRLAFSGAGGNSNAQIVHVGNAPLPRPGDIGKLYKEIRRLCQIYEKGKARNKGKQRAEEQDDEEDEEEGDEEDEEENALKEALAMSQDEDWEDGEEDWEGDARDLLEELQQLMPVEGQEATVKVSSKAALQDSLADEALRLYRGGRAATYVRLAGKDHTVDVSTIHKGVCGAVVSRMSTKRPHPFFVAIEHIKNHLVMIDYIQTWLQHQQQNPLATLLPLPTTFNSFVLCRKFHLYKTRIRIANS